MARMLVFLVLVLCLVGCSADSSGDTTATSQELTVFAASSLTDAFNELAEAFEADNPGVQVLYNFGASSQLAAQLSEGVVADIFASANATQMQTVVAAERLEAGTEELFVSNRLTIVVPADNPAGIQSLEDLGEPGVQLILSVEGVPVRDYADDMVAELPADFQEQFYANVVSEEDNVRQVSAKVALGEADAGIVYTSDITPDIAEQVQQIIIPDAQNVIAGYPIAPLVDAPHPDLAQRFVGFLLSPDGQEILSRWGFGPPPAE